MIEHKTLANNFPYIKISNTHASAKIALQGAHVYDYQAHNKPKLLWLSAKTMMQEGKAIRGGIPICFPWFGKHPKDSTLPQHGFARTSLWALDVEEELADGSTYVRLKLSQSEQSLALWEHRFELHLDVYVGESLRVVLHIHNTDEKAFEVGTALHSYLQVSDIAEVRVDGLDGAKYYDALSQSTKVQKSTLHINKEIDRVYFTQGQNIELHDATQHTSVKSQGSCSVVIWNPWKEKSIAMADMSDDGYKSMLCVETSNALADTRKVEAGQRHSLEVRYAQSNVDKEMSCTTK